MNVRSLVVVYAETDDVELICKWQGEPLDDGSDRYIGGNPHYITCDEKDDGKPEMTKKFRLMFRLPPAEVEEFEDRLKEAGFTHISPDYPLDI
jgi:hypothetical protein